MIRVCALCLMLAGPADAACRQALALGLDVSGSVDAGEYRLQLDGLAAALQADDIRARLLVQPDAPVYIAVYEWSGHNQQPLILTWTPITSQTELDQITLILREHSRPALAETTALGQAMLAGFGLLDQMTHCWKRTLDISGDGKSNSDIAPENIPQQQTPSGVTVNALVIGAEIAMGQDERISDIKELTAYFRTHVIRGPDAFVESALTFEAYANAMERKLRRELAALAIGAAVVAPSGG